MPSTILLATALSTLCSESLTDSVALLRATNDVEKALGWKAAAREAVRMEERAMKDIVRVDLRFWNMKISR